MTHTRSANSKDLRRMMRARRRGLSKARQLKHSRALCNVITGVNQGLFRRKRIGIYQDFDGELATAHLIKRLRRAGARLYVPIIRGETMQFAPLPVCGGQVKNQFNILEPTTRRDLIEPQQFDILLTPLTAFDRYGNRMGMGAGYYDRCFEFKRKAPRKKPLMVGIAHSCQEVGAGVLKPQIWDVQLDYIATERGLRKSLHRCR